MGGQEVLGEEIREIVHVGEELRAVQLPLEFLHGLVSCGGGGQDAPGIHPGEEGQGGDGEGGGGHGGRGGGGLLRPEEGFVGQGAGRGCALAPAGSAIPWGIGLGEGEFVRQIDAPGAFPGDGA